MKKIAHAKRLCFALICQIESNPVLTSYFAVTQHACEHQTNETEKESIGPIVMKLLQLFTLHGIATRAAYS